MLYNQDICMYKKKDANTTVGQVDLNECHVKDTIHLSSINKKKIKCTNYADCKMIWISMKISLTFFFWKIKIYYIIWSSLIDLNVLRV